MTTEQELDAFVAFARAELGNGGRRSTLDDLFDRWRLENPTEAVRADDVAAVRASLDNFDRGERGEPAAEETRRLRHSLGVNG